MQYFSNNHFPTCFYLKTTEILPAICRYYAPIIIVEVRARKPGLTRGFPLPSLRFPLGFPLLFFCCSSLVPLLFYPCSSLFSFLYTADSQSP